MSGINDWLLQFNPEISINSDVHLIILKLFVFVVGREHYKDIEGEH